MTTTPKALAAELRAIIANTMFNQAQDSESLTQAAAILDHLASAGGVEVVVGCLPTMNSDPYPSLGDWWVQLWDGSGDDAKVIARVYGESPKAANERAKSIAAAMRQDTAALSKALEVADGLRAELEAAYEALAHIGDFAHDKSTGPAVPDALWEVRSMAYDAVRCAIGAALTARRGSRSEG